MYDVVIVGGGAAGLAAAVRLKKKCKSLSVAVAETLDRVGKKLITTGNGRCNITNKYADISRYHSGNIQFVQKIFDRYFIDDTVKFFSEIGTEIVFEEDGRAYPASYQASSVVDSLRFAATEAGVEIITDCRINDIVFGREFTLISPDKKLSARSVILASGLLSGGAKLGSDGSIFNLLKNKGFKTVKLTPSIVQIKTENSVTRQLKGIKLNAAVKFSSDNSKTEFGEVLFTDYGLSGPAVLQLSRAAEISDKPLFISLDLIPGTDEKTLIKKLKTRRSLLKSRASENFLVGFINKRVGQVIIKQADICLSKPVSDITDAQIISMAKTLKNFEFRVLGSTGFANSQVTAGGISLSELNSDMQCKKQKGLFMCGELLDVDGDCGGFNLQWAWSGAFAAADGVIKYLEG